jgi:hypothetical protein
MVMRNPRREARRSRLVGHLQAKSMRERTHCRLGDASVGERSQHMMVGGSTRAGSVRSPSVVGILPVRDGIQPVAVGNPVIDPAEEFLLTVKTTISPVRLILRTITFVCHHLDEPYAHLARDVMGGAALVGRETGGDSQQGDDPLRIKGAHCERQQERGVDASGEGNSQPPDTIKAVRDRRDCTLHRPLLASTERNRF